jgi:cell volume regulation protein A
LQTAVAQVLRRRAWIRHKHRRGDPVEAINQLVFQLIFVGALLVAASILLVMISSRIGAPLLLVFLGIGMLAGEDGIGGIPFSDFRLTYLVGSVALAIILFDGGLRTPRSAFRIALAPAASLATVGVLVTAVIAGVIACWALQVSWLTGLLIGATIASTDAAAVFLLLHARGTEIAKRVSATLEVESGMNDPMAIFLTIACIEWMTAAQTPISPLHIAGIFAMQMLGGTAIGIGGGFGLLWLINRIEIAAGLYPILAAAAALTIFAGAQLIDASGFLAIYLTGLVLGNNRHRAQQVISRFHDGLAWLSQITMFLLLGLLVTPSALFADWRAEIAIALALILVARPAAVFLALAPFRFDLRERSFIAWVGLRGAVPIFLASIPVMAGIPDGMTIFNVAFVVVIASLLLQGWTIAPAARFLGLELPPAPEQTKRQGIDLPLSADREAASWRVAPGSPALATPFRDLNLPRRTRVIAVIRDGAVQQRDMLDRLQADDYVIALAAPQHVITLDRIFSTPSTAPGGQRPGMGDFLFNGDVPLGRLHDLYAIPLRDVQPEETIDAYMRRRLGGTVEVGDHVPFGTGELIVYALDKDRILRAALAIEPAEDRLPVLRLLRRLLAGRRAPDA